MLQTEPVKNAQHTELSRNLRFNGGRLNPKTAKCHSSPFAACPMSSCAVLIFVVTAVFAYLVGKRKGGLDSQQSQVLCPCMLALISSSAMAQAPECHLQAVAERERILRKEERAGRTRAEASVSYPLLCFAVSATCPVGPDRRCINMQKRLRELTSQSPRAALKEDLTVYPLKPIGILESCFRQRNGTPRQPLLVPAAKARLKLRYIVGYCLVFLSQYVTWMLITGKV